MAIGYPMNTLARLTVVIVAALPLAVLFIIDGLFRCVIVLWKIASGTSATHADKGLSDVGGLSAEQVVTDASKNLMPSAETRTLH
jgi:hypothetical protein